MPIYHDSHSCPIDRPFSGSGVSIYVALDGELTYRSAIIQKHDTNTLKDAPSSFCQRVASASAVAGGSVDEVVAIDPSWDGENVQIDVRPYANGFERIADAPIVRAIDSGDVNDAAVITAALTRNETRKAGDVVLAIRATVDPVGTAVTWLLEVSGEDDVTGTDEGNGRIVFRANYTEGSYTGVISATVGGVRSEILTGIAIVTDSTGPTLSGITGAME